MFTGIVEQVGEVVSVTQHETYVAVTVSGAELDEVAVGASISVNGVCLTAVDVGRSVVVFNVIPETLDRSNLGQLEEGSAVNLERPMPASGRFDGHIVQGHVDGVGTVTQLSDGAAGTVLTITPPKDLLSLIVEKGSITVDGVSLTVSGLTDGSFSVALIPHTLRATTLGLRQPGDVVNLEVDVLAKYVERLLEVHK